MTLAQILTLALLAAALYFFYAGGYLPVSSRIALLYAGGFPFRTQHNRIEARFSGCRGSAGGCRCALGSRIACSWR